MAHPNTGNDTPGTFSPAGLSPRNPTTPGDLPQATRAVEAQTSDDVAEEGLRIAWPVSRIVPRCPREETAPRAVERIGRIHLPPFSITRLVVPSAA